ncbi:hypothetical protein LEP1GSC196_0192 [Leptospira meyeri serovar Semaranga str. Veldrot Semarang 173]|nr:hypothetical protein LEP1GSC196_0192 [Leptospira meyeri serovar Semaranga str. Veldrot Semarang 173]
MNPVKELSKFGINESDKILFAKFDQEKASIELISGESWKVVNILQLKKYKDNIFELSNFSDLYIHLRYSGENFGQHSLRFIREKDNTDSMLIYGYFVYELKSIADCKKYAKDWQDEANESNCKKESCYGN